MLIHFRSSTRKIRAKHQVKTLKTVRHNMFDNNGLKIMDIALTWVQ